MASRSSACFTSVIDMIRLNSSENPSASTLVKMSIPARFSVRARAAPNGALNWASTADVGLRLASMGVPTSWRP